MVGPRHAAESLPKARLARLWIERSQDSAPADAQRHDLLRRPPPTAQRGGSDGLQVVKEGRVYIAQLPLYKVEKGETGLCLKNEAALEGLHSRSMPRGRSSNAFGLTSATASSDSRDALGLRRSLGDDPLSGEVNGLTESRW